MPAPPRAGSAVGDEQRFDFAAERGIGGTRVVEITCALGSGKIRGGEEEFFDASPVGHKNILCLLRCYPESSYVEDVG